MINIDKNKLYSANEMIALEVFPGKDLRSVTRMLLEDKTRTKPRLNADIRGDGKMRRYYVLGKNILKFLKSA